MDTTKIELTQQQLVIINNSIVNIIAGPYAIENNIEFHTLIGGLKEEADAVRKYIGSFIDSTRK